MAGKKFLVIDPTTGKPFDAHTDEGDSWDSAAGANAPSGSIPVGDGAGNMNWAGLGAYAAAQTDHGFTGYTSHFGPHASDYDLDRLTAVDEAYIFPVIFSRPTHLTEIFISVTTVFGGGGTEVKYGFWADNGHAWPGTRLVTGTETVGAATLGPIIHAIDINIKPGVYYAGMEGKDAGLKCLACNQSGGGLMGWVKAGGSAVLRPATGIIAYIPYANFPTSPYSDPGNTWLNYYQPKPVTLLTGTFVP